MNLAREMLQTFLVLNIDWTTDEITVNENIAKVRGHAKLSGSGVGFSQHIMDLVNQLSEPWVFTWRTDGWKPDDWKLIFLDALKRELRAVPNLDGTGFVNIGRSSSDLTKQEMTDLIELLFAFGAKHGVVFADDREASHAAA